MVFTQGATTMKSRREDRAREAVRYARVLIKTLKPTDDQDLLRRALLMLCDAIEELTEKAAHDRYQVPRSAEG
jgi:hypothetical protein